VRRPTDREAKPDQCALEDGLRVSAETSRRLACDGGPTRLDNLALLRRRHHRAVHEEGYQVTRDPERTLHFSTPSGRPIPEVPTPPPVPPDASRALIAANQARGLAIGPRTGCPSWLGERLDLGWALDVLHPAAQRVAVVRPAADGCDCGLGGDQERRIGGPLSPGRDRPPIGP
jgi:hypothetical protein